MWCTPPGLGCKTPSNTCPQYKTITSVFFDKWTTEQQILWGSKHKTPCILLYEQISNDQRYGTCLVN